MKMQKACIKQVIVQVEIKLKWKKRKTKEIIFFSIFLNEPGSVNIKQRIDYENWNKMEMKLITGGITKQQTYIKKTHWVASVSNNTFSRIRRIKTENRAQMNQSAVKQMIWVCFWNYYYCFFFRGFLDENVIYLFSTHHV